jgi:hypothetical protein
MCKQDANGGTTTSASIGYETQRWQMADALRGSMDAAELVDVLLYLIQLSPVLGIDPIAAAQAKLRFNESTYSVTHARGSSKSYDEL